MQIDGVAATLGGDGTFSVLPGQQVAIRASESVTWLGSADGSGVTRTEVDTSATQWISRFVNPSKTEARGYKLAISGSDSRTMEITFSVQPGDYRNGSYMVFATSGAPRHTLDINFDSATYSLRDASGVITSGALTAPAGAGDDWFFQSSRITGANTSSLKPLSDTIVGAFPFDTPFAASGSYTAAPFVATRGLVLSQAKLDGVYNRGRINVTPSTRESAIAQIEIAEGGTVMKQCVDLIIYRMADCPPANTAVSRIEPDVDQPGIWTLKNVSDGALTGRFGVAMVDGDKVYLSAGQTAAAFNQVFAIGVPEAPGYADFTSRGWSTKATLDTTTVSSPAYTLDFTAPTVSTLAGTLTSAYGGTTGMRQITAGSDIYFAMRSSRIEFVIGARSQPATRGFLHLGVVD